MTSPDNIVPLNAALEIDAGSSMDSMPLPLLVMDAQYIIHYANAAAERVLNTSFSYMQGRPLEAIIAFDESWRGLLMQATAYHHGAKGNDLSLKPIKSQQPESKVNVHVTTCLPFKTEAEGRMLVLEPSVASQKLGGHVSQRHAMRSAAVMAEILAHEVRNPLAGIRGAAQLLRASSDDADDRSLADLIVSEVGRIGGLLNQVEYFSTDKPIQTEAVNIHEILRYVAKVVAQGTDGEVCFHENYDPSLPPLKGNRELLIQALLNLVNNAVEAVKESGETPIIHLKTAYRSGYRLSVPGLDKPVRLPVCVQIGDNGPGIDEALRANIFDPFVTNKPSGKGLGLAVVAKIVADHGGVMALESAEPGNTVFTLQLPAV